MHDPYAEQDDANLARAARDDPDAFDALYRRHVTRVYRYCCSRVGDRLEAEDLTAQTFCAALEGLAGYRGRGAFAAWLFAIARRKCVDHHRQAYANPCVAADVLDSLPDPATVNVERGFYRAEVRDCVQRVLGELSPDRREALALRFWGGLSAREAAAAMGKSAAAVKMLVWRGIVDLRERCLNGRQTE